MSELYLVFVGGLLDCLTVGRLRCCSFILGYYCYYLFYIMLFNIHSYSVFSALYIGVLVLFAIFDVKWAGKYEQRAFRSIQPD